MKKQLLLMMVLLIAETIIGQNHGSIKGKIIDNDFKEPLIGATVQTEIGGEIFGTVTDVDGRFTLKPLPSGVYNLKITFVGYASLNVSEVRVTPDRITFENDLVMFLETEMLDSIEITAKGRNPLINADDPGRVTMLQTEIKSRADRRDLKSIVSNLTPGISKSSNGDLHFRGSRAMAFNYYVDGIKMDATTNLSIPSRAISSVSVYAGGIPAKYGDVTGGVIIIETMTYGELYRQWKARNM